MFFGSGKCDKCAQENLHNEQQDVPNGRVVTALTCGARGPGFIPISPKVLFLSSCIRWQGKTENATLGYQHSQRNNINLCLAACGKSRLKCWNAQLGAKIHTKKSHREKWHNFPKKSLHKFSISFVHPAKRSKQNFFRCKSNQLLIQQKKFEGESKLENVAAFVRFQNKESSIKMFQFLRKILFEPKNAVSVPEKSFFKNSSLSFWSMTEA